MKLFTAYNRINLLSTVFIFLLASTAFYFALRYVLMDQVDDNLRIEQREVDTYAARYHRLPELMHIKDQEVRYAPADGPLKKHFFRTVQPPDSLHLDDQPYREIVFHVQAGGQWYEVVVGTSMEGTDDITKSIISITLGTLLLILLTSFVINRIVVHRLWKPFYHTLSVMRRFEIGKMQEPDFPVTRIDEFDFMNETLRDATARAREEYLFLKEFTENASHELQTPLAIIQSKFDLLIQDEGLSEAQSQVLHSAYQAVQKMARLNQSLLLLTKIENGQFADQSAIDLPQKIQEKIIQFEELTKGRHISLKNDCDEGASLIINPLLADILLNNLFSNAIKYTPAGGRISVVANTGLFAVGNTGHNGPLDGQQLFRRFGKPGVSTEGVGLGLAIIKQISDMSRMTAGYSYREGEHWFSFEWGPTENTQNRLLA